MTTDNASSNSKFVEEFCKLIEDHEAPFNAGNWVRCVARIIHLTAQNSIHFITYDVERVAFFKFWFFSYSLAKARLLILIS